MGQLAKRVPVVQRKPQPVERRPIAEAQPPRSTAHANGFAEARVKSPVSEIVGGLPARLRAGVESLSGIAMDDVRVHRNSSEPAKLEALAFTRGSEIHLAPGQEQHLPHEAWHVVQQKQGRVQAITQMKGSPLNDEACLEAEATTMAAKAILHPESTTTPGTAGQKGTPVVQRQPAPASNVKERVLSRTNVAQRDRTIVKIDVVGHASPRWRSARTAQRADDLNWNLAEDRARQVRTEAERLLKNLLPNRNLVFEYRYSPSSDMTPSAPIRALDEPVDIALDFRGRGSTETLAEAGKRGRKANDDPMRRVDVRVSIHSQGETDVEEKIERSERKHGATSDWSIYVTGEAGVEAVGKASAILIQLKNNKTGRIGTYAGWTSGVGASVGINIAKTSLPDFENFKTPEPMTFADFSGANFSIQSHGFAVGVFGAEYSKFRFEHFLGGKPVPSSRIQVGGLSFGGFEINIASGVYGAMFLTDNPSEYYTVVSTRSETKTYESLSKESNSHRVFFSTGSSKVTSIESDNLNAYIYAVVTRSGF